MINAATDQSTLRQQRAVLVAREESLRFADSPQVRADINKRALERLSELVGLLTPCIVRRHGNGQYIGAYLVQRVGVRGYRLLVRGEKWELLRAKANTEVRVGLDPKDFTKLISLQEEFFMVLAELLKKTIKSKSKSRGVRR
jgi:hypothetical protein